MYTSSRFNYSNIYILYVLYTFLNIMYNGYSSSNF